MLKLFVSVGLAVLFTSCSLVATEETVTSQSQIVGSWKFTGQNITQVFTFDNSYNYTETDTMNSSSVTYYGTYSIHSAGTIIINANGTSISIVIFNVMASSSELTFSQTNSAGGIGTVTCFKD